MIRLIVWRNHPSVSVGSLVMVILWVGLLVLRPVSGLATDQLQQHWHQPKAGQSPLPTLQSCGECHPDKLRAWQGSHHAKAFSPGLVGQLLTMDKTAISQCLSCHAPLAEQLQAPLTQDSSAKQGISCLVCHLRDGQIVGPHLDKPAANTTSSHHKSVAVAWFSDAQFCGSCHQFPLSYAINGKPLENTLQEWQNSSFAQQGVTCQSCHMPGRQHLFRGIHDPETVREAVDIQVSQDDRGAVLTLTSVAVGHRFPTYVVPRVRLIGRLLDRDGQLVLGGMRLTTIQRQVESGPQGWVEISDTRLQVGQSARVTVPWRVGKNSGTTIQFQVVVQPDYYYSEVTYPALLQQKRPSLAQTLIRKAQTVARENSYTLYEKSVQLR